MSKETDADEEFQTNEIAAKVVFEEKSSEAVEAENRLRHEIAAVVAVRGDLCMIKLRFIEANEHFTRAASLLPAGTPELKAYYEAQAHLALDQSKTLPIC